MALAYLARSTGAQASSEGDRVLRIWLPKRKSRPFSLDGDEDRGRA